MIFTKMFNKVSDLIQMTVQLHLMIWKTLLFIWYMLYFGTFPSSFFPSVSGFGASFAFWTMQHHSGVWNKAIVLLASDILTEAQMSSDKDMSSDLNGWWRKGCMGIMESNWVKEAVRIFICVVCFHSVFFNWSVCW